LRSDVPLALTFSGGVDSGTIAALAKRSLGTELDCYTVDYHTREDPSEETLNAEAVARCLGLQWCYIHFDYHRDLLLELDEAYRCYDQPCLQLPLVYANRLYHTIRPHATVVLCGNGADELFTGYEGDERHRRAEWLLSACGWVRPWLRRTRLTPYLRMPLPNAYTESLLARTPAAALSAHDRDRFAASARALAAAANACEAETVLDFRMWLALRYSAGEANFRIPDISGLAAQVEVRSPFLDHRLVEFAARLPHAFKVSRAFDPKGNKYLPKLLYQTLVPRDIAWSRKKGMGWNLRWDLAIAQSADFDRAFEAAYSAVAAVGIDARSYRSSWRNYVDDVHRGVRFSKHAGAMMSGFMLGAWLQRHGGVRMARGHGARASAAESNYDAATR
ncbi:MAG: asparagine synthase, partial [Gammaproteobacteria bacterium]|nr:asparagine synthase [Gammaproteobacteria bacterium]